MTVYKDLSRKVGLQGTQHLAGHPGAVAEGGQDAQNIQVGMVEAVPHPGDGLLQLGQSLQSEQADRDRDDDRLGGGQGVDGQETSDGGVSIRIQS
jgi:hypothetical protein